MNKIPKEAAEELKKAFRLQAKSNEKGDPSIIDQLMKHKWNAYAYLLYINQIIPIIDEHTEKSESEFEIKDYICKTGNETVYPVEIIKITEQQLWYINENGVSRFMYKAHARHATDADWIREIDWVKWQAGYDKDGDVEMGYKVFDGWWVLATYKKKVGEQLCAAMNVPIKPMEA